MSRRNYKHNHRTGVEEAWVNLMPLIDVVFVVLVMFIVIAPMIDVDKVNLAEGVTTVKESDLKRDLSVYVRADNSVWVHKRQVSDEELLQVLTASYQQNPGSSFQLYHDKDASFGTYQKIQMIGRRAGFQDVDVILNSDKR